MSSPLVYYDLRELFNRANKRYRSKSYQNSFRKQWYMQFHKEYRRAGCGVFGWDGFDAEVSPQLNRGLSGIIERYIYDRGLCAAVMDPVFGLMILPVAPSMGVDAYGLPVNWRVIAQGYANYEINQHVLDWSNSVLIYDNIERLPTYDLIDDYVALRADIQWAIEMNMRQNLSPFVAVGDDAYTLEFKQQYQSILDMSPVVTTRKNGVGAEMDVLNLGIQYLAADFKALDDSYDSRVLQLLGVVGGTDQQKKAQITENESKVGIQQTAILKADRLANRQKAAEHMNKLWGLDIQVFDRGDVSSMSDPVAAPFYADMEERIAALEANNVPEENDENAE